MFKIFVFIIIGLFIFSPFFRCFCHDLPFIGYYWVEDTIKRIKRCKDLNFNLYGVEMFISESGKMFGNGKTLSMTHKAMNIYKRYGDSVRFISNYELTEIPYIPLINFQQLVDLGTDDSDYIGTVVLIDEISSVLNNRAFAKFPLELLSLLMQQRKRRVFIMCTCQRQHMVDVIFRNITSYCIACSKWWRFVRLRYYDAWAYENSPNSQYLKPLVTTWWFCRDKDYNAYDTSQMISKSMCADFISNEEAVVRLGLDTSKDIEKLNKATIRKKYRSSSHKRK